jgi:hypothetical protein
MIVEARKSELSDMAAEMQRLYQNKDFVNALKATDAAIDYQKKYNIASDYEHRAIAAHFVHFATQYCKGAASHQSPKKMFHGSNNFKKMI